MVILLMYFFLELLQLKTSYTLICVHCWPVTIYWKADFVAIIHLKIYSKKNSVCDLNFMYLYNLKKK